MTTFKERVNYAARVIREGRRTSRKFDNCFEMNDGDLVVLALVKRANKSGGKLAENLDKYISSTSIADARSLLSKETKHTAGPWEPREAGDANFYSILKSGNWLMEIHQNGELPVFIQEKNARLIAAAPELLEALVELYQRAEQAAQADGGSLEGLPEYDRAQAAIAKAKGE